MSSDETIAMPAARLKPKEHSAYAILGIAMMAALMITEPTAIGLCVLIGCVILASTNFAVAFTGKHKTLGGQLWGIVGLSAPCVPILLASGLALARAGEIWLVWLLGFTSTTMAVRGVIAAQKRESRTIHWWTLAGLTGLMVVLNYRSLELSIVILPMLAMSWYLMVEAPHPKQLKRVGWTLVVGTIASAIWMATVV